MSSPLSVASDDPIWVEVDLSALRRNLAGMLAELDGCQLMAVVKAEAYGHGLLPVAKACLAGGAAWLGVARVSEGLRLRAAGLAAPCLVLGYTPPEQVLEAVSSGLAVTVFDQTMLAALESAGSRLGRKVAAHLKVDTGLTRLGLAPQEVGDFMVAAARASHVDLQGIFTHLRMGHDQEASDRQLELFSEALAAADRVGHQFPLRHLANSSGWPRYHSAPLNMVRSGLELLGLTTGDGRRREPILSLKTRVVQLRAAPAGAQVGYGDEAKLGAPALIATLAAGYGDGFRRSPRNWGSVLIGGRECPLVGDVSMDMAMVVVPASVPAAVGDEAVLIGRQGELELSAELVAERLGTINYEVVTAIATRVPRRYLN